MGTEFADKSAEMFKALADGETGTFRSSLRQVFQLSPQVPPAERAALSNEIAPLLSPQDGDLELVADLAVLAGALVEGGVPAGTAGVQVMRMLHSWAGSIDTRREAGGQHSVARRLGLAAKTMLTDAEVRAAVRADEHMLFDLEVAAGRLRWNVGEFHQVARLLMMADAVSALVLDRRSGRGFRVAFDGVWSNFQLHTLLVDALVGAEGRGLEGERPCSGCVAIESGRPQPTHDATEELHEVWSLWDYKGRRIDLTDSPADFPLHAGERVIVLGMKESALESWTPGYHCHDRIRAHLTVRAELPPEETTGLWSRIAMPEGAGDSA
ncbi:hypothetical protein NE235_07950 [Actinoallomurus spadix]|uniref:Uncharacterized protein n=1 Tax=Actinoallomurus spadix TaxID=79912 RepID=A0ABN0X3J1_9ACTN|nr:hypothetical protein [Actinoallomurus spadix]MCO5986037.1 hypothetical protein [Actinoallomurus spadix]